MRIRPFVPSDADALATLFHASVRETAIREYTAEQVAAWSPSPPDSRDYLQRAKSRTVLVAVDDDDRPVGYGDLEPNGHIDHLYCCPDAVGTGVGSAIYVALEAAAKQTGVTVLFVEASEGAHRLFKRNGFRDDARNDFAINGVAIHNYRMSKPIV